MAVFFTGTRTTKDASVQTDKVIVLPEPRRSSDFSSLVSDGVQIDSSQKSPCPSEFCIVKRGLQTNGHRDELSSSSCEIGTDTSEQESPDRSRHRRHIQEKDVRCDVSSSTASRVSRGNRTSFDGSRPRDVRSPWTRGRRMQEVTRRGRVPSGSASHSRVGCDMSSSAASRMSRGNQRSLDGSRPQHGHSPQRESARGSRMQEVTRRGRVPSGSVSRSRISGHRRCRNDDDRRPTPLCPPAVNSGSDVSQGTSLISRRGVVRNPSAAGDNSQHLMCGRRHRRGSDARDALPSHDRDGQRLANRSRQNTEASADGRSNHSRAVTPTSSHQSTGARSRKRSTDGAVCKRRRSIGGPTPANQQPVVFFRHLSSLIPTPYVLFPPSCVPDPLWRLGRMW